MTADSREWMLHAACRDRDPEVFFPHPNDRHGQLIAAGICRACPVRGACRDYADRLGVTDGMWGGRYVHRKPVSVGGRPRHPHGTEAAYKRHRRLGEPACQTCLEGYARDRRFRPAGVQ